MLKKLTISAVALVFALAVVAVGNVDNAVACDKNAKSAKAEKAKDSSCSKSAAAKTASSKSSCSKSAAAKTASSKSSCSKSAAAKTASSKSSCSKSAAAKTASTMSGCSKSAAAKTASSSCCLGASAAKTASAGSCDKSSAAKTARAGCCEGKAAVAGYSKAGNKDCDTEACPASACEDKYAEALKSVIDEIPVAERSRMVVVGTLECGHCTYDAVATCQPLIKTSDGKVYPMLHNNIVEKMHHSGAKTVEVSSNVRNAHGVKYLDVKAFKSL